MNGQQRIDEIKLRLQNQLQPTVMEVIDEGHLHVGHAGAKDGRGHFRLKIVAGQFAGLPLVQRHRLIYQAVGDLMQSDIHALAIEANAPED